MRRRTPLERLDHLVWNVVNLNCAHARLSIALGVVGVTASPTQSKPRWRGDIQTMPHLLVIPNERAGRERLDRWERRSGYIAAQTVSSVPC